jgi:outer membrane protein
MRANRFAIPNVLVAVLALAGPAVSAQSVTASRTEILHLDEALALALRNNAAVKSATLDVERSEDRVAAARTGRRPMLEVDLLEGAFLSPLEFGFARGAFGTFPATGPVPPDATTIRIPRRLTTFVTARAAQPLSQLYRIGLGIELQEMDRDLAQHRLDAARQAVANEVKRAYYAIVQTERALEAREDALALARELHRLIGEQVVQQVSLEADGLESGAWLAREEARLLALRHSLAAAKEQLNHLLGRDIRSVFSVVPLPDSVPVADDADAAYGQALGRRPEVQEARVRLEQARRAAQLTRAERFPDVSLLLAHTSLFNVELLPRNITTVGLFVSWTPFDWGRRRHELADKRKAVEQARTALREAEDRVLLDVNQRFRTLEEARAVLAAARLEHNAVRERARVTRHRYVERAALARDLLQAQAALAQANATYHQAVSAYWTARADFERAVGAP